MRGCHCESCDFGLFSAAKVAPFLGHKFPSHKSRNALQPIQTEIDPNLNACQVGQVGSNGATMAAFAAHIHMMTRKRTFRAPYAALRFSSV